MKLFGLVLISATAAAVTLGHRQARDLAASANGASSFGPGNNNKIGFAEPNEDSGKGGNKKKKPAPKKPSNAQKKPANESDDGEGKKKKKKKRIDCDDEAVLAKYIEELLAPNETHDDISNYVKCKKENKRKLKKEHKKYKKNHLKEQKKLKQEDNKNYKNKEFYNLISQESSRTEPEEQ